MVIGLGNRQMENDSKLCITRMIYKNFFVNYEHFNSVCDFHDQNTFQKKKMMSEMSTGSQIS